MSFQHLPDDSHFHVFVHFLSLILPLAPFSAFIFLSSLFPPPGDSTSFPHGPLACALLPVEMSPSPTKKPPSSPHFRVQQREFYQQSRYSTRLAALLEREVTSHVGFDQLAVVASSYSPRRCMSSFSMNEDPNSHSLDQPGSRVNITVRVTENQLSRCKRQYHPGKVSLQAGI